MSNDIPHDGEKYFQFLFENMLEGYAFCEMIYDESGKPEDFIYKKTNKAFETLSGLKDVVGKKVTDVVPGIKKSNPEIFEIYGRVIKTGKPEVFETYVKPLNIWLKISVYSPGNSYFVAVFDNITENKKAMDDQIKRNKELRQTNSVMVGREVRMAELKRQISDLQRKLAECEK